VIQRGAEQLAIKALRGFLVSDVEHDMVKAKGLKELVHGYLPDMARSVSQ
jgi:hypothetical protein